MNDVVTAAEKAPHRRLTPDEKKLFWELKAHWQTTLGLQDWRLTKSNAEPKTCMAMVDKWDFVQRQASMKIGAKWHSAEANPTGIDRTVLHELLHVLLSDLSQCAVSHGADQDQVVGMEHRIINVLENLVPISPIAAKLEEVANG